MDTAATSGNDESSLARRMVHAWRGIAADGRYWRVRAEALLEDSVIHRGDNVISRLVSQRGYQHWKAVQVSLGSCLAGN